jgi:hypothetical protein
VSAFIHLQHVLGTHCIKVCHYHLCQASQIPRQSFYWLKQPHKFTNNPSEALRGSKHHRDSDRGSQRLDSIYAYPFHSPKNY